MDARMLALLLRLYPRPFRQRYAGEMEEVFRMQLEARRERGALALAALRLRTTLGMLGGAAAEWRQAAGAGGPGKSGKSSPGGVHPGGGGGLFGFLEGVATDVRLALRGLRRQPVFAVAAIGTLGLGIGGVTTMWSVVHGVLLKPLPYPEAERLVAISSRWVEGDGYSFGEGAVGLQDYREVLEASTTVEDAAATGGVLSIHLRAADSDVVVMVRSATVSANFLSFFGVEPLLGRTFLPDENDPGRPPVVILGHGLWRSAFGGDPAVLGRSVQLGVRGTPHTIVGVAPRDLRVWLRRSQTIAGRNTAISIQQDDDEVDLWIPFEWAADGTARLAGFVGAPSALPVVQPVGIGVNVVGRLKEGASIDHARAELHALETRTDGPTQREVRLTPEPLQEFLFGPVRDRLWIPLFASALVLLLACFNVANLLLSRASVREREMATRSAVGAGRSRLARQLLTETLVVVALGTAVGAGIALVGVDLIARLGPPGIARLASVRLDRSALAFCAALALVCALLVGLLPAWRGSDSSSRRQGFGGSGRPASPSRALSRSGLIAAELGMALVVLASAGLLMRSFARMLTLDMGFQPRGVLMAKVSFPQDLRGIGYADLRLQIADDLMARLEADPRVSAAAVSTMAPIDGYFSSLRLLAGPEQSVFSHVRVSPRYFEVLGHALRGRPFTADDDRPDAAGVVIVAESFAAAAYPGEDALGRELVGQGRNRASGPFDGQLLPLGTIVGVASGDPFTGYPEPSHQSVVYGALDRSTVGSNLVLLLRAEGYSQRVADLAPLVRTIAREVDPRLVVYDVQPLEAIMSNRLRVPRFYAGLFSVFGLLAAAIAAAGVFGVLAFLVSQRTHEIGVRLALGGAPRRVAAQLVRQVGVLALAGLAVGAWGALAVSRLMESWLYEIEPIDPVSLAGAAALLVTAAVAAAWLPVRRAVAIDPATTLRAE